MCKKINVAVTFELQLLNEFTDVLKDSDSSAYKTLKDSVLTEVLKNLLKEKNPFGATGTMKITVQFVNQSSDRRRRRKVRLYLLTLRGISAVIFVCNSPHVSLHELKLISVYKV